MAEHRGWQSRQAFAKPLDDGLLLVPMADDPPHRHVPDVDKLRPRFQSDGLPVLQPDDNWLVGRVENEQAQPVGEISPMGHEQRLEVDADALACPSQADEQRGPNPCLCLKLCPFQHLASFDYYSLTTNY